MKKYFMPDAPIMPIRLSQLTHRIGQTLQAAFGSQTYWVIGEVTSYSFYAQKSFHFFDLVEKADNGKTLQAKIGASAWSAGHQRIRAFEKISGQVFKNDIQVLLHVSVDYHPVHGLKCSVLDVDPAFTIGALERQRLATLQRLLTECQDYIRQVGEEYLTLNKELKLRKVIQRIAVVTSSSSAGWQDFQHTLTHNRFGYTFTIDPYLTTVQGETSAAALFDQLLAVFNSGTPYDAILILRGGGAQTDFLPFDQFDISRIVAKFPIPVITGIGHQKNETIVDLMAHTATKTPTKAAEWIIAHNRQFEEKALALQQNIIIRAQQTVADRTRKLSTIRYAITNASRSTVQGRLRQLLQLAGQLLVMPRLLVAGKNHELLQVREKIKLHQRRQLEQQSGALQHYESLMRLLSPASMISKGFAILKINGRIVTDPGQIRVGEELAILLSHQQINAQVTSKEPYAGNDFDL